MAPSSNEAFGSFYVSVKLPTYPSPKPTLTLSFTQGQVLAMERGRWAVPQKRNMIQLCFKDFFLCGRCARSGRHQNCPNGVFREFSGIYVEI